MKKFILPLLGALPLLAAEAEPPLVAEVNSYLQDALAQKSWWAAVDYADLITEQFPTSPFAQETPFQAAFAYYQMGQLELSNETLTDYLNRSTSHAHFEEAIQMKFEIAESYRKGAKKSLFGSHKLPKWMPAQEDAVMIYDEIVTSLPHTDLAAKALLGKALVQQEMEEYKPAVETLQTLIRRFPKHDLAAQGYLEISKVYLDQSKNTSLDLDVLELAEVNLRKFKLAFPREPRIVEVEQLFSETQELFAENLLETGRFFQRTNKVPASMIYYNKVIAKYPHTKAAEVAREKLLKLQEAKEF